MANSRKETVVFLDQNKWIDLALAYHNQPRGEKFKLIFDKLMELSEEGNVIVPLDASRYIETGKINNSKRKKRLATVMAMLSNGWSLAPEFLINKIEIKNSIAGIFDGRITCEPFVIGKGVSFAFGKTREFYERIRLFPPSDKKLMTIFDSAEGVKLVLGGVRGGSHATRIAEEFAIDIEKFRKAGKSYNKNLREKAYAVSLTYELQDEIQDALLPYQISFNDFTNLGEDKLIEFWANIPTLDTEIQLSTERSENYDRAIPANDFADAFSLSVAIPYCDIVVIEKYFADLAIRRGLDKKYNTKILTDLNDVIDIV